MNARAWAFAGLVAIIILGGCTPSTLQRMTGADPIPCQNSSAACDVAVGVYCPSNPASKCLISVEANVVEMRTSAGVNKITWWLQPSGNWQFTDGGIVFAAGAPFRCQANGPFKYECTPTSTQAGEWKYKVAVAPRGVNRSADPLDPWVVTN